MRSRIVSSALWIMTSAWCFLAIVLALLIAVDCFLCAEVIRLLPSRRTVQPFSCGTTCWCHVLGVFPSRELLKKKVHKFYYKSDPRFGGAVLRYRVSISWVPRYYFCSVNGLCDHFDQG